MQHSTTGFINSVAFSTFFFLFSLLLNTQLSVLKENLKTYIQGAPRQFVKLLVYYTILGHKVFQNLEKILVRVFLFFSRFAFFKAAFHAIESVYLIYIPQRARSGKEISHNSTYLTTASTPFREWNILLLSAEHPKGSIYRFLYSLLKCKISNIVQKFGKIMGHLHPRSTRHKETIYLRFVSITLL